MKAKKQIAVYVDYSIRIPNFQKSYENFKENLFKDNSIITYNDEITDSDFRFFWQFELKNPSIENFYIQTNASKIKDEELLGDYQKYFFNDSHLKKFLEEYSYNLFSDCDVPSKKDINLINICQKDLFDVVLIDRFSSIRKISNTLFFLSKVTIYPRNIIFLGPKDELDHSKYYGVWNPLENKEHRNSEKSNLFLNWLQELEKKHNAE